MRAKHSPGTAFSGTHKTDSFMTQDSWSQKKKKKKKKPYNHNNFFIILIIQEKENNIVLQKTSI